MVELQSRAGLVNASALCSIVEEVEGRSVNTIAELAAELQREREKNARLMERITLLEAQIQESNKKAFPIDSCIDAVDRSLRKFKRQKIEQNSHGSEDGNITKTEMASNKKSDIESMPAKYENVQHRLVNWMSTDETQFLPFDKIKDNSADSDDYFEEDDTNNDQKDKHNDDELSSEPCLGSEMTVPNACETRKKGKEIGTGVDKELVNMNKSEVFASGQNSFQTVTGSLPTNKKSPKVPFCPKEVKRILESDTLLLKNAQSHTVRKIIVFASLGIRHGCEDMYELDFNHFSILNKGKPYMSPDQPGEHVLYENPGVRRKMFYPNRQNPTLCPVQILEEEKAMRPSDPTCLSCLFLCIKYGGRTRNLPQNEYVRQRMGRNKLKSFGPVICRMAMLVCVRNGSFFFKSLGITLLFMAGFPGDLVQRETKHRNLDLLQKYVRRDEDAEGEELFLSHPIALASPTASQHITTKTNSIKPKGRKQTNTLRKYNSLPKPSSQQSSPPGSANAARTGLMNYTSVQSMQSQASTNTLQAMNPSFKFSRPNTLYHNQTPYHMYAPQPANIFMPVIHWPPPNAFPYPSGYGYRAYSPCPNYISIHPQAYYNHPSSSPFNPNVVQGNWMGDSEEAATESDGSSSGKGQEEPLVRNKADDKHPTA